MTAEQAAEEWDTATENITDGIAPFEEAVDVFVDNGFESVPGSGGKFEQKHRRR
jgi:hypothetical protein